MMWPWLLDLLGRAPAPPAPVVLADWAEMLRDAIEATRKEPHER